MKTVILAEKPNQARAYAGAMQQSKEYKGYIEVQDSLFNGQCVITYGFGHLVGLKQPSEYKEEWGKWDLSQLPMIPETFQYGVSKDKQAQFSIVKKHLQEADEIIIATDIDREGEAIARLIIMLAGCSNKMIKRLWINSLEKDVIRKGFTTLKSNEETYNYFIEAQTRSQADWLVGMNLSRLVSILTHDQIPNFRTVLSIGRVQTPTLYMIYDRNREIETFKPQPYKEVQANINHQNGQFTGKLVPEKKFFTDEEYQSFFSQINPYQHTGLIQNVEVKEKSTHSPKLFSLSQLQSKANSLYKASASQTLQAVQNLYEAKLLTYPRTDCNYITDQEFIYLAEHIDDYFTYLSIEKPNNLNMSINSRYVNNKKVQEHHAIIPTKNVPNPQQWNKLGDLEQKIYQLVLKQTLAMFYPPYRYSETKITTQYQSLTFETKGNTPLEQGWKALLSTPAKEDSENQTLPKVSVGDPCEVELETLNKETKPPKYFTEGTLITAMKNVGKTVEDDDEKAILSEVEGIGTEATRAGIIETLKKREYITIQKNQIMVTENGNLLCQLIEEIPLMKSAEMTAKWEKSLANIGKAQNAQQAKTLQAHFLQNIQKFINHEVSNLPTAMKDNQYIQQSLSDRKASIEKDSVLCKCPACQSNILDKGNFYSCENYKECHSPAIPKTWGGKKIPKQQLMKLVNGQKTDPMTFKSKNKKNYTASLIIKDGKVQMEFENK